jgi:hypothetical protein
VTTPCGGVTYTPWCYQGLRCWPRWPTVSTGTTSTSSASDWRRPWALPSTRNLCNCRTQLGKKRMVRLMYFYVYIDKLQYLIRIIIRHLNSVRTNSTGSQNYFRYSHDIVITMKIYVCHLGPKSVDNFVCYSRLFVVTVIAITKFDYKLIGQNNVPFLEERVVNI